MTQSPKNKNKNIPNNRLSVQVSLAGLSFLVQSGERTEPLYFNKRVFDRGTTPAEVLAALKSEISTSGLRPDDCNDVQVVHSVGEYTLVPAAVFDSSKASDYLKFNSKILPSDYIAWDHLPGKDIYLVYIPLVNINNYLFETFGEFDYYHATTILLKALNGKGKADNTSAYAHVQPTHFDLLVYRGKQLLLCNSYPYSTAEDFTYYLLFAFEQLKLDREQVQLAMMGLIDDDSPLYQMAYRYIRNVELKLHEGRFSMAQDNSHQDFLLKQLS